MKVEIIVTRTECQVRLSNKTGNKFAQQPCGVLFPGEDYPMADQMLVEMSKQTGEPVPVAPGRYTADATISKVGYEYQLSVNFRNLQPVQAKAPAAVPASQRAAA